MEWLTALWNLIAANWGWVTAFALPFLVAAIARCSWSSAAKGWLAVGVSLTYGVLGAIVAGISLTPDNLALILPAVVGGVQIAYMLFRSNAVTAAWLDSLLNFRSAPAPTDEG